MSSPDDHVWLMSGHDLIFDKIMLMIGHSSLVRLDNCRKVCRTWNDMIMNKIWVNPTKRWGTIIQRRMVKSWRVGLEDWSFSSLDYGPLHLELLKNHDRFPSYEKISKAKLLGKHKLKILLVAKIVKP